jgi:hypothetical protein
MLESIQAEGAIRLNIVDLLRHHAYLCFDLYLEGCSEQRRSEIDQSLERPIHLVFKKKNTYWAQRHKRLDAAVARTYTRLQTKDKGPRPYFYDIMNPPLYDGGRRVPSQEVEGYAQDSDSDGSGEKIPGDKPVEDASDEEDGPQTPNMLVSNTMEDTGPMQVVPFPAHT